MSIKCSNKTVICIIFYGIKPLKVREGNYWLDLTKVEKMKKTKELI